MEITTLLFFSLGPALAPGEPAEVRLAAFLEAMDQSGWRAVDASMRCSRIVCIATTQQRLEVLQKSLFLRAYICDLGEARLINHIRVTQSDAEPGSLHTITAHPGANYNDASGQLETRPQSSQAIVEFQGFASTIHLHRIEIQLTGYTSECTDIYVQAPY